jgi:superfamily II DNA or RNA helicase
MANTISIGNSASLTLNRSVTDYEEGFIYASCFGYTTATKNFLKEINKKNNIYVNGRYHVTEPKGYEIFSSAVPDSDYSHTIVYKKDKTYKDSQDQEYMRAIVFLETDEEMPSISSLSEDGSDYPQPLIDAVFDKFCKLSSVPMLKEWVPYVMRELIANGKMHKANTYSTHPTRHLNCYVINVAFTYLINTISDALSRKVLNVNGTNEASETMKAIDGLDAYLNTFTDVLATRIQESFSPRFDPATDKCSETLQDFSDYADYMGDIKLYPAQRSVIQATSNALDHEKSTFIIGECGAGKTIMGAATIMTNNRDRKIMTNIVLCPGHLVEKWKAEIERRVPISDAVIVDDFESLVDLVPRIKDKRRKRHLWLVISKETAKFGYEERPAAVWSSHRHCYVCPECGQPLYTVTYEGRGRNRRAIRHYMTETAFSKKGADNSYCMNDKRIWDRREGIWKKVPCHAKLWEANIHAVPGETFTGSEWIKLRGSAGWMEKRHVQKVFDTLIEKDHPSRQESTLLSALSDVVEGDTPAQRAPRKFPIAKYIHRYLKGNIDYFVADEVHLLKAADSLQGEAFGDLAFTARKTIGLTGTLLNGYASGIFYILYRAFPGLMKKEGYSYSVEGENDFMRDYGVIKKTESFEWSDGRTGDRSGKSKVKPLPGVSPLVFTKFLLENATFIGIEDISDGLPGYTEIPVPVPMDNQLKNAYNDLENDIRRSFGYGARGARGGMKTMAQMLQTMSVYPDQPYDQPPIIHPDTGETVCVPADLPERYRNKEDRLLELVQQKLETGEKVLVYYNWTNRTNLSERLPRLMEENGIKAAVLTSSVKSRDREQWIADKLADGVDVLICNPSLVETGLDLLDFTTIIYYQMGYNLFTMRQASRRSWRLSQTKDVEVYFLYYAGTIQEQALSLMATKLQAAMAIEGKFSEEGLNAMSNNEDILTQIASSVAEGIKQTVDIQVFEKTTVHSTKTEQERVEKMINMAHPVYHYPFVVEDKSKKKKKKTVVPGLAPSVVNMLDNPAMLVNMF